MELPRVLLAYSFPKNQHGTANMVSAISSLDGLMPWMSINGVRLNGVRLHDFGNHRGHGVIATDPILAQSPDSTATGALISIPSSLVLDEEHVEVHAKVDRNFGDLLKTYNGMVSSFSSIPRPEPQALGVCFTNTLPRHQGLPS